MPIIVPIIMRCPVPWLRSGPNTNGAAIKIIAAMLSGMSILAHNSWA